MKPLALLILSTFALCLAPALTAQTVEIKPRWIPGKRYFQTAKMQQSTKMELAGQKMDQNVSTMVEVVTTVEAGTDLQRQHITQRYARIAMNMEMMGQKTQFDSADPGAPDALGLGKTLGALINKDIRIIVDETGKLIEIENADEVAQAFAGANPMAVQMAKGMFSKEAIAQGFNQAALKAVPGKPVKSGDHWPYSMTVNLPQIGAVSLQGTYTLKGMAARGGANCAEIADDSTMSMDLSQLGSGTADSAEMQKLAMKVEGGVVKGTVWFDPALGAARETAATQTMKIKMNNPMQPGAQMEMPMTQTTTITLTKVEDAK